MKSKHLDAHIALSLFALALALRLFMLLAFPFDGLYGQDAYAYFDYASTLRVALSQGQAIPEFFWPLGFPLHVVSLSLIVGLQPAAGQFASMIAGAAVASLTFVLVRELLLDVDAHRARRAGIFAALIVATAGQMMISSVAIMSDATGLMWATLSAWLTLRYARTLRAATLVLAAFTLGVAVITRWVFGLLALPWVVCVLLAWRRDWQTIGWRRAMARALMALVAGGLVIVAQLSLGREHTGDLQTVGWDPTNVFRREVTNSDGTFRYDLPIGVYYASTIVQPSYIFPLFAPLWLAGLWALGYYESAPRALLIGWPLVGYVFLAGIAWQSTRFALMFFPALAAWVALGFDQIIEARPHWRRVVIALAALGVVASLIWSMRATGNFVAQNKNADLARVHFVAERVPPDARVLTFSISPTFEHYTTLDVVELYHETPDSLVRQVCRDNGVYVFVNVESIEQQWHGLAPDVNFRWLRDARGLEVIDRIADYTLFNVNGDCS